MSRATLPVITRDQVVRLWLHRQGLATPRAASRLTKRALVEHLTRTGGLQLDPLQAVERAHYLTLWSRFGAFDRSALDRWVYRDRVAYEYWSHEASLLPIEHLPLGRRRMRRFPPKTHTERAWWEHYQTSPASKRRVLRRLRDEGPLESAEFAASEVDGGLDAAKGGTIPLAKEDRRSLKLLWHAGRVAVRTRRHFRCVWDLAERVYPDGPVASPAEYEDTWLLTGLSGNGVASERHLVGYLTAPELRSAERKRVVTRCVKRGEVVPVRVEGIRGMCYALPEHLDALESLPQPEGTTLICPFDSFLWQRQRAEELLGFRYRIEIYVPPSKREYGYYVLPILHEGRLVGRLDPKMHRDRGELEVKGLWLEDGFVRSRAFERALADTLDELRGFLGAGRVTVPRGWSALV